MVLFYNSEISHNTPCSIIGQEHIHLSKTLRLKQGERIYLTDGKGSLFNAEILSVSKRSAELLPELIRTSIPEGRRITISIAPTKSIGRFEWFLEKATEIGVDEIYPITTKNSERSKLNKERLEKIMISAMKQSNRLFLPKLHCINSFQNSIASLTDFTSKLIAYTNEELDNFLLSELKELTKNTLILIGPEGGFTNNELSQAKENGFNSVSLGDARLRSETAGVVAATLLNSLRI